MFVGAPPRPTSCLHTERLCGRLNTRCVGGTICTSGGALPLGQNPSPTPSAVVTVTAQRSGTTDSEFTTPFLFRMSQSSTLPGRGRHGRRPRVRSRSSGIPRPLPTPQSSTWAPGLSTLTFTRSHRHQFSRGRPPRWHPSSQYRSLGNVIDQDGWSLFNPIRYIGRPSAAWLRNARPTFHRAVDAAQRRGFGTCSISDLAHHPLFTLFDKPGLHLHPKDRRTAAP